MTKEEFVKLDAKAKKALAAKRSQERAAAKKKGLPVPPTLAEEFGTKKEKPQKEPEIKYTDTPIDEPETPFFRTIKGFLHWTNGNKNSMETYQEEAGNLPCHPYMMNGQVKGYIWGNINEEEKNRLTQILTGHQMGRVTFKKG